MEIMDKKAGTKIVPGVPTSRTRTILEPVQKEIARNACYPVFYG